MRIHYCHGLESGPSGYKARSMRRWADVTVPDQEMSLWNLRRRNSVGRGLLRQLPRWPRLSRAIEDSVRRCVDIHLPYLNTADVLVGSSWGGLIAMVLLAEGHWSGPTVLLCPAYQMMERRAPEIANSEFGSKRITETIRDLSLEQENLCIVHGTADTTIPLQDSQDLARISGFRLEVIQNGTHGLGAIVSDGRLERCVRSVATHATR